MTRKENRKRKREDEAVTVAKRAKVIGIHARHEKVESIRHEVLSSCYTKVSTLRQFFLKTLTGRSKRRKRAVATYCCQNEPNFLDTTLVGHRDPTRPDQAERYTQFLQFSQSQQRSSFIGSCGTPAEDRLTEVRSTLPLHDLLTSAFSADASILDPGFCAVVSVTPISPCFTDKNQCHLSPRTEATFRNEPDHRLQTGWQHQICYGSPSRGQ